MSDDLYLIQRYPWLPNLKNLYGHLSEIDPLEFLINAFSRFGYDLIKNRVMNIFNAIFENYEKIPNYEIDELNVYLYLIIRMLVFVLDDKTITNRIANLYSKQNNEMLSKEDDYYIYKICEKLMLDVKWSENPWIYGSRILKDQIEIYKTNFKIHFSDYLKLAILLRDKYRRLVNNPLEGGYVYITKQGLARLIQEYIRYKFLELNNKIENSADLKKHLLENNDFKKLKDLIEIEWKSIKDQFEIPISIQIQEGENVSEFFPPCVNKILKKAEEGQNLNHNERLYIVWFLLSLNYPVERVVDIFSNLPDFDRKKTEYQVEFAKRKGYTPYKCESLKVLGLCPAREFNDNLCLEGYYSRYKEEKMELTHPLKYVRIKRYRSMKKASNNAKKSENQNQKKIKNIKNGAENR
ncbi:MAG: hypothetical protein ACTSQS_03540 [Promethearchaeota archaeon]